MQFVAPVNGLFVKKWLNLAHCCLAEIDYVHEESEALIPVVRPNHSRLTYEK
jgi:hypothetical protein